MTHDPKNNNSPLRHHSKFLSLVLRHQPELLDLHLDARMAADGHVFFRSDNGVWLTDQVPSTYLEVLP